MSDEGQVDRLAGLSTRALVLRLGLFLFVLTALPTLLVEVPPFQDLPNHLASMHVVSHPEKYPELVFNGHFKTNGALFAWLHVVSKITGLFVAAKLFVILTCAVGSFVLPWAVVTLRDDKRRAILAALFAWPLVHNWFLVMGMLDYALGVPLSIALLALCHRALVKEGPRVALGVTVAVLGAVTWYAHGFALLVAYMLVFIELLRRGGRGFLAGLKVLALPLLPAALLVVWSVVAHLFEPKGNMTGHLDLFRVLPAWELVYNAWAEWTWTFSKLEALTLVPTIALAIFAYRGRKDDVPFFSRWAGLALLVLYVFVPYTATNWFHVNSRFLAYLWFFALVRVPAKLPRGVVLAALAAGLVNGALTAVDYVRLDRERRAFTAGIPYVPQGSRLLPLIFRAKGVSENSRNLLHAWAYYVIAKDTSAPLLFAHSRSFPVMYREPPPDRWNHMVLEGFAPGMPSAAHMCGFLQDHALKPDDCEKEYQERWAELWTDAVPRFDHVLLWEATPEALATVPPAYVKVFAEGKLVILERRTTK